MLTLSDEELDWLSGQIPDAERSPKGGRPPTDKRQVIAGVFWVLDNGAKWKDLPSRFGPKSTVHRWFLKWVNAGVFESLMRAAGRCVEDTGRFRLYECFIDGTFSKAKSGGDGIGCTRVGKGVKIMILVDAQGLPVAACSTPANLAESHLIQQLFAFMIVQTTPARVIGDKAYDSDRLDELLAAQGIENDCTQPAQSLSNPRRPSPATLQTTLEGRTHHRLAPKLSPTLHSLGKISSRLPRFPSHGLRSLAHQGGFPDSF